MLQTVANLSDADVRVALVVTVGGSAPPIIYAMQRHQPDYIVFICSGDQRVPVVRGSHHQVIGSGNVCSDGFGKTPTRPNIRVQAAMEDVPFDVVVVDRVDDLQTCYRAASEIFTTMRRQFPRAKLVADYTGGTKTMSAGLAAAAVDDGQCWLSVVSGDRNDLIKVEEGTQFLRPTDARAIHTRRQLARATELMAAYDYPALETLAVGLSREQHAPEDEDDVRILTTLSRAFEAWDRFDHATALQRLNSYRSTLVPYVMFLESVCLSRQILDDGFQPPAQLRGRADGYEVVEDLLLNAERCAHRARYDDALGRLYRATEMLVQFHLKTSYQLSTSDLDRSKLPQAVLNRFSYIPMEQPLHSGLLASYDMLEYFPDDKVWHVFSGHRKFLLDALKIRNYSLFAHGFKPVTKSNYDEAAEAMGRFIHETIEVLASKKRYALPIQFPKDLIAPFRSSPSVL